MNESINSGGRNLYLYLSEPSKVDYTCQLFPRWGYCLASYRLPLNHKQKVWVTEECTSNGLRCCARHAINRILKNSLSLFVDELLSIAYVSHNFVIAMRKSLENSFITYHGTGLSTSIMLSAYPYFDLPLLCYFGP